MTTTYSSIAKFAQFVQLKDYRAPTKKEYVRYLLRLADHYQCDPAALTEDQIRAYYLFLPAQVWWIKWVVDVQAVGSGAAALKYLAAYVNRGPLHPTRIEAWDGQRVTFRYRDSEGAEQRCTVSGLEFVRRLLQHVPPKHFQRVRHYGWRAGAAGTKWERILALLDWRAPALAPPTPRPVLCARCGRVMQLIATLARAPP